AGAPASRTTQASHVMNVRMTPSDMVAVTDGGDGTGNLRLTEPCVTSGFVVLPRRPGGHTVAQLMHIHALLQRAGRVAAALALLAGPLHAQTVDDGLMMAKHELLTGNVYTFDTWDTYWEGTLQRQNGNIGTITTRTNVWTANYGLTDRLNIIGGVPYI